VGVAPKTINFLRSVPPAAWGYIPRPLPDRLGAFLPSDTAALPERDAPVSVSSAAQTVPRPHEPAARAASRPVHTFSHTSLASLHGGSMRPVAADMTCCGPPSRQHAQKPSHARALRLWHVLARDALAHIVRSSKHG